MEATFLQVPTATSGADSAGAPRHGVGAAALQARGARRESGGGAPTLPPTPTTFPGLPAAAVSGGRPSQPDNSRHLDPGDGFGVTHCFANRNIIWHGPCSNTHRRRLLRGAVVEPRTTSPVFAYLMRRDAPSPARGAHFFPSHVNIATPSLPDRRPTSCSSADLRYGIGASGART